MGRLILCCGEKAETPWYLKETDTKLYSIEELCYYIYNNIYIISERFFTLGLAAWIGDELKLPVLAEKLKKLILNRNSCKDMVVTVLCGSDYYTEKEMKDLIKAMDSLNSMSEGMRERYKADLRFKKKRFTMAAIEYRKLLHSQSEELTPEETGDTFHNLGIACLYTGTVEEAARHFLEAYGRNHRRESLVAYVQACKMAGREVAEVSLKEAEDILKEFAESESTYKETSDYRRLLEATEKRLAGKTGAYYEEIDQLPERMEAGIQKESWINMGLFSWFRKNKKKDERKESIIGETLADLLKEPVSEPFISEESGQYEAERLAQMQEAKANLREAKIEYEAVTSYFTDTQKIEMIPEEEKKTLLEAAEKILHYKGEREKCKGQEIKLSERHHKSMAQYEESITAELKKMQENEKYQSMIKNDMRHLEGEKGALTYEREEIVEKQEYLKKLAVTTAVLVVVLIFLLAALSAVFEVSMSIPFLLTVIMGVASAFYMIVESRKNRKNMALTEKKLARAISLLNKVKIKYVNNTNCLEYAYEKLGVESSMELEYVWKQYLLLKERERQFRKTTEKINEYNQILIEELKKYGINDAEVWTYQPEALIDRKEMVEVRHRLNVRRQKLRERMDYNNKIIEGLSVKEI